MSNVEKILETVCADGEQRLVRSDRGVYSYAIRLCTQGPYSFSLESDDAHYTRACGSAGELHGALIAAMENMGEDDPDGVVDDFIRQLSPRED